MSHFEIFSAAVQIHETQARQKYLDEACGEDVEVRRRVEELLRSAKEAERLLQSAPPELKKELDPLAETDVTGQGQFHGHAENSAMHGTNNWDFN